SPGAYVAVSVVAILAALVLLVIEAPRWAYVVLSVVAAVAWLIAAESALRLARHRRRMLRALKAYAPTIGMAFAGRSGAPWQLRMWEPYLVRSGEHCVVINLHPKYTQMIRDGADLTSPLIILGSRETADLDTVLVPTIRALFYVQNAQRNAEFMAYDRLTHVWLNHGDSDKPANFNERHAAYDVLVVCGQAGIDRYARHGIHVDPEKFVILGRPQASGILPASARTADPKIPAVLYAPTWHGLDQSVNFSSLEKGPEIVRALLARGCRVIFRPHPLSYRWRIRREVVREIREILKLDREETGRWHVAGNMAEKTWSVADCANHADVLISDVSSVVSDFLQSEKPYAMASMRASIEDFRAEFTVAQTAYVLLGDLSNLDDVLDDLLVDDPLAAARRESKRYVLGDFVGDESAEAFANFVRQLAKRGA
ncbi:MAG: hypothetical protein JWR83_1545, partial [Aeromicrobium sp.]|nr:hypothetical protein [Aeromicrobium sp.]